MNRIYLITNKTNNKKYIGITTQTIELRWYQHLREGSTCRYLKSAIKKYGIENFKIEEIYNAFTLEDCNFMEQEFIKQYNSLAPNGYNLRSGGKVGKFSQISKDLCSIKQKENWNDNNRKLYYKEIMKNRWKNPGNMTGFTEAREKYIEQKKEPIIGIHIKTAAILRFPTINEALNQGFYVANVLNGSSNYDHNHVWFYDEGHSDEYYTKLAENKLGGFGNYSKGKNSWKKCDKNSRIKAMQESAQYRAKPIIGINRFDASVLEYPSKNQAIQAGINAAALYQCLIGKGRQAGNYCWFYKTHSDIPKYIEASKQKLGHLFSDLNIKPFKATNLQTGEVINFRNLREAKDQNWKVKEIRQVLNGRRKSYHGWKFELI